MIGSTTFLGWIKVFLPNKYAAIIRTYAIDVAIGQTELLASAHISIFPNPTNNKGTINNFKNKTIELIDMLGRQLNVPIQFSENNSVADLESLNPGVYFIQIINGNEKKSFPIIKQ